MTFFRFGVSNLTLTQVFPICYLFYPLLSHFIVTPTKPDKEKSTEKIDGAVATIMALDRAIRGGGDTGASIYDERGLLLL